MSEIQDKNKEQLECLKLEAEIYQLKKPIYHKVGFYVTITLVFLTIIGFLYSLSSGYLEKLYDANLRELESKRTLLAAENKYLDMRSDLLEQQIRFFEPERKKLEQDKKPLVEKNAKLDEEYEKKSQELKEEHEKEILALKEEYTKLKEKVKSMSSFTNWYDKGAGEYNHKRYDEAISSFTKALSKKSDDDSKAYAYNFRGSAYLYRSKFLEALADFKKSTDYSWGNPLPHLNMADTYLTLGTISKAEEEIKIMNGLLEEGKLKGEEKAYAEETIKSLKERLKEAKKGIIK
jgi:tetratricopeptide (TPR) repeat protein